eukprot:TRINITY_DN8537_c0_g1_i1.p1 TRINITY_DN8537_c0_g1~~TRINITY_DN8537_c0_g1_i1.p1  ORF type:complete len:497 (+),score=93.94 TRINITY_DN8537_c0_g1_i1:73-1563(+)
MSESAMSHRDRLGRMHGYTPPLKSYEFLTHCFFVLDNRVKDEADAPEDSILFFYPPNVPIDNQVNVTGLVQSLAALSGNFTTNPMETLCMEHWKAAFRHFGEYSMILTGSMEDLDTTLLKQLDDLAYAFSFFNGPFSEVVNMHPKLEDLRKDLSERCFVPLKPLLTHFAQDVFNSICPIPYTELPNYSNRLFLSASQILHLVRRDRNCLGGCILYEKSILCTHLDFTITRWIMTRQEVSRDDQPIEMRSLASNPSRTTSVFDESHHIVFLTNQEYDRIQRECIADFSSPEADLPESVEIPAMYKVPRRDGHWVGLYILHTRRISLAVLLSLKAIMNERYTKKLRVNFESKLIALETKVSRAIAETPPIRENTFGVSVPQIKQTQFAVQSNEYNYLVFDEDGRQARGNALELSTPIDLNFVYTTSVAHDIFQDDPCVSQIVLRDFSGTTYARKVFSREVFFQDKSASTRGSSRDDPMGDVERKARERLAADHNIQLI